MAVVDALYRYSVRTFLDDCYLSGQKKAAQQSKPTAGFLDRPMTEQRGQLLTMLKEHFEDSEHVKITFTCIFCLRECISIPRAVLYSNDHYMKFIESKEI